jgi:hypothetical protein
MQVRATEYESEDSLRIHATNGPEIVELFYARGVSGATDALDDLAGDGYRTYIADIPESWTTAWLVITRASPFRV